MIDQLKTKIFADGADLEGIVSGEAPDSAGR